MSENPYLLNEIPELEADIFNPEHAPVPGVMSMLKELHDAISNIQTFHYMADPMVAMTSGEYHQIHLHDYKKLIDAKIYQHVSTNIDCRFILLHYDFVYNHFLAMVSKYPENTEAHMVVETIIELIFEYYSEGLPIDYARESDHYKIASRGVFQTQSEILNFYTAIRALYEGNGEKY